MNFDGPILGVTRFLARATLRVKKKQIKSC
jgi:hypothetical protein